MAKGTVLCDLIPTTDNTGNYSSVPSKAIFNAFHGVHVNFLRQLFVLGICIFHAISDKTMKALYESLGMVKVCLSFDLNGSHLKILETAYGLIMTTSPAQHNSHALWGALKLASRIYHVHGFTTVRMIAAMITETFLPRVRDLVELVYAAPETAWSKSTGAYAEAVMKGVRLLQFRQIYGDERGNTLWEEWYQHCKVRAGKYW